MKTLTSSRIILDNGRIAHVYEYNKREFRVIDDAENALLIIDLFSNRLLTAEQKLNLLINMLFADPQDIVDTFSDDIIGLLASTVWQVCGLDIDGSHKDEYDNQERCLDWEQDAGRIRATLLQNYGVYWDDIKTKYTYSELLELLTMAPRESPFGLAIYYRISKEPEPNEYNDEYRSEWRKARDFFALKDNPKVDHYEAMNNRSNDAFAALARKAVQHG